MSIRKNRRLLIALSVLLAGAVAGIVPAAAAPERAHASLLPSGPLHTSGAQLVDQNGTPVRIASVGWFDNGSDIPGNVAKIVDAGFNAVRLPWTNASMNDDLGRFDQIIAAAGQVGLKVILDNHANEGGPGADGSWRCSAQQANGLWYDVGGASDGTDGCGTAGTVTDAKFLSDWQSVAERYQGNDTVIGYDLRNEPLANPGQASWGDGNADTDLRAMYERVGNALLAIDGTKLIIAEGRISCGGNNPYGTCATDMSNLADPGMRVTLSAPDKLVYSVHEYPKEISSADPDSGPDYVNRMTATWGFLVNQGIAPVWIGELGSSMQSDDATAWANTIVPYLNSGLAVPVSTSWWAWGNLTGEVPDGTLDENGNLRPEQYNVYSQLQSAPAPACTESADRSTVTSVGPTLCDAAGNQWAIAPDATMTMNGQYVQYSARVIELAYVDGVLWQENADNLWWAWTGSTWAPTDGTSTSPL